MKNCELCKSPARLYCESDQANLCWRCDEKVHKANFLVAKHVRCLFCNICHMPMSWTASGAKIGRTVAICERCIIRFNEKVKRLGGEVEESEGDNDEEFESGSDFSDSDSDEDSDDLIDENHKEDCDNQVVPWSSKLSSTPPPAVSSTPPPAVSSSDSEVVAEDHVYIRSPADLNYQNKLDSSSERVVGGCIVKDYCESLRPIKFRRLEANRVAVRNTSSPSTIIREEAPKKAFQALYLDLNEFPKN